MSAQQQVPVAIVGAGPVGLSLALGLTRHGVRSVLIERKAATNEQSRAPAIHVRTREIFRQWGVEADLLRAGTLRETLTMHRGPRIRRPAFSLSFSVLEPEAEDPGLLVLEQGRTEALLLEHVRSGGLCDVRFGTEAEELAPREDGARLDVRGPDGRTAIDARFVVGCDGPGSFVRTALGVEFPGRTLPVHAMLADVQVDDDRDALPWPRMHNGSDGWTAGLRLAPGRWRLIRVAPGTPAAGEPVSEEEVRVRTAEVIGEGPAPVLWSSRFRFQRHAAGAYRVGAVALAGDAAHTFPPTGGQGMNAGIQDAHNLAWKLAAALNGGDTERLLGSYDAERRGAIGTVSQRVVRATRAGIQAPRPVREGMIQMVRLTSAVPSLRLRGRRRMAMLDVDYPASPLLSAEDRRAGTRLPDPALRAPDGTRVRLHRALPFGAALIAVGTAEPVPEDLPVEAVLRVGPDGHRDPSGLLRGLLGADRGWILVRPDRYVAWARSDAQVPAAAVRKALGVRS